MKKKRRKNQVTISGGKERGANINAQIRYVVYESNASPLYTCTMLIFGPVVFIRFQFSICLRIKFVLFVKNNKKIKLNLRRKLRKNTNENLLPRYRTINNRPSATQPI